MDEDRMKRGKKVKTDMKEDRMRIYGIYLPLYCCIFIVVCISMWLDILPGGMVGTLLILMVFGGMFQLIGDHLPIIRTYLGGGTLVCIFGAALMAYAGLFPASVVDSVNALINDFGFLEFFISALIAGSILSMDRKLLMRAAVRFLPVAFCSIALAMLLVAIAGAILGYGASDAVMYIAIPMMSGGMGAGVVPLSGMYAQAMDMDKAIIMSRLIPASTLGNVAAILTAALLNRLGEIRPSLTGNGKLMKNESGKSEDGKRNGQPASTAAEKGRHGEWSIEKMGLGMVISFVFCLGGVILHALVPAMHMYAWMIVLTILFKWSGLITSDMEDGVWQWSQFMLKNWTCAVLIGIGISLIDIQAVAGAMTPLYLLLIIIVVVGVAAGAAIGGHVAGFYPIESAITAGLCTTNMGGTGNIAVLSAARRMELLPFAQLATRICGSMILVVASILLRFLA